MIAAMTTDARNDVRGTLARLLQTESGNVHLVGVCGVGMAGLALLLKARGFTVSGCDLSPGHMGAWLAGRGIDVDTGHHPDHVLAGVDWLVRSPAVPLSHPELSAASMAGKPVFRRGEVLPELLSGHMSIAVCGTHGKTTTASFTAQVLRQAGVNAAWCIGGDWGEGVASCAPVGAALDGAAAEARSHLVVEADESDGTLVLYRPDITVVTNIEFDHMEHFDDPRALEACFREIAGNTRRMVIFCRDDPRAARILGDVPGGVSYGFSDGSVVRGRGLSLDAPLPVFTLEYAGVQLGQVRLPVAGRHNVLNALAAAAVCLELGLSGEQICTGLGTVGLPRRRFEKVVDREGIRVISDYAHHPTETAALLETASGLAHSRLLAVFQPHRYSRTLALGPDFPGSFQGLDELVLVPVYAASEEPRPGGTVWDLYRRFREGAAPAVRVSVAETLQQAWQYFRGKLEAGDVLLVVGAGDVEKIAHWAASARADAAALPAGAALTTRQLENITTDSRFRANEPMSRKTTLAVGGTADMWAEIGSIADLRAVLEMARDNGLPLHVIGAGSNVLVSDLGVRGIVVRLAGPVFGHVQVDGCDVTAGGGVSLVKLLDRLQAEGLGGLEFLEGIPARLGGAARMNAGAWGQCLGEHLSWIRCLNRDGSECILRALELGLEYRHCGALADRIMIEAGLRLTRRDSAEIVQRRQEYAARREWMKGLKSGGSVFKNPEGDFAGRLLDCAGLKKVAVGQASVCARHANVVVTRRGCSATDVRALIEMMRSEVKLRFGIDLEAEIQFFG
jgi:UDP-N-acetylmuramate--L-alanine ligase/UDP-N-acetylenolpyruvoylglucosamine reductase